MKKNILFIIVFIFTISAAVAQVKSQVSESFELVSIAFRLAEAPEYVNNQNPDYVEDIDGYFAKYKKHKLISFLSDLRNEFGISFDAVAVAAAYIEIEKGRVIVSPDADVSQINQSDDRWSEQTFRKFVDRLNDFYRDTQFRKFYLRHAKLYDIATERMNGLLEDINWEWFQSVLDEDFKTFNVVVSLVNGASNYGFLVVEKDNQIMNGIVIGARADSDGLPIFRKEMSLVVAHELLHAYGNKRITNSWEQIASAATKIYSSTKQKMEQNNYGNEKAMMHEWFTSLLTFMYMEDNPLRGYSMNLQIRRLHDIGFIWMGRSVEFMKHFRENRGTSFVLLDDYMPQIISFINYTAEHFEEVVNEYENRCPYVKDAFPVLNSVVSPDIKMIEFRFSEPMSTHIHGISIVDDDKITMLPYVMYPSWKDEYTFQVQIDERRIEKGKTYGLKLNRNDFQSEKTYPMSSDYIYVLKIAE